MMKVWNTPNKKIFIGKPDDFNMEDVEEKLSLLLRKIDMNNEEQLICAIEEVVPTYVRVDKFKEEVAAGVDKNDG